MNTTCFMTFYFRGGSNRDKLLCMNTTCFMTFYFRGGGNRDKILCVNTTYVQCFIVCFSVISPLFRNQDYTFLSSS